MASQGAEIAAGSRDEDGDFGANEADTAHGTDTESDIAIESVEEFEEQTVSSMIEDMLLGDGPTATDIMKFADSKISMSDAMKRLDGVLPEDISSLVSRARKKGHKKAKHSQIDQDSLNSARGILNTMIESSWAEMDAKVIECKEFESSNRATHDQIKTDMARLGQDIADLERMRTEANQGVSSKTDEVDSVQEFLTAEISDFNKVKLDDEAEMTIRRNGLAVVHFIMELTKCPDRSAGVFVQARERPNTHVCSTGGGYELRLDDPKLQAKFDGMMTPNAKALFHKTLSRMVAEGRVGSEQGLIQWEASANATEPEDDEEADYAGDPDVNIDDLASDSQVAPQSAVQKVRAALGTHGSANTIALSAADRATIGVSRRALQGPNGTAKEAEERVHVEPVGQQWKKCVDMAPKCGILHDMMSLMWGKFKDSVDELEVEMDQKDAAFDEYKKGVNAQIQMLGNVKAVLNQMLSEAISNMNEVSAEAEQKGTQQRTLAVAYQKTMKQCKRKIQEILFTNICAVRKVRNSIMTMSTVSPPASIVDCDVSEWMPTPCSLPCDDMCPQPDPYACGGVQILKREVVQAPNEFGIGCPVIEMQRKCNQMKCPLDCAVSEWSGWGKCTKDCGGGVQGHTRSVLVKPKNGGKACDSVQEERACHTGSCKRDCTLADWSVWDPCSRACGGGVQKRDRGVLIPTRGAGKCPKSRSSSRFLERLCNPQVCVGDEVCVAKMDFVIAIDMSGSMSGPGSRAVRTYAERLVGRFAGMWYGDDAMKVGVVQFGNGEAGANNTISPAIRAHSLTFELHEAKQSIATLEPQTGFTNMAQALIMADTMLTQGGRVDAMSAVLVITDCKPSFVFQTKQKVEALKEKNVKLFFTTVSQFRGKGLRMMEGLASEPWETHLVNIPGIAGLMADPDVFVQQSVTTFCPKAISPSFLSTQEEQLGFFLLKSSGRCGARGHQVAKELVASIDCKNLVRHEGVLAFSFGKGIMQGSCWIERLAVTHERVAEWEAHRDNPSCPEGEWIHDEYYDLYVIPSLMTFAQTRASARALLLRR